MSNRNNTEFLERKYEQFSDLLLQEKWEKAQEIIDVLWDNGFDKDAESLRREYLKAQTETITFEPVQDPPLKPLEIWWQESDYPQEETPEYVIDYESDLIRNAEKA